VGRRSATLALSDSPGSKYSYKATQNTVLVDGVAIYDYLIVKDDAPDFVDTYIDRISTPFLKEFSFFVDLGGQRHPFREVESLLKFY
jgi:hypothetical protein